MAQPVAPIALVTGGTGYIATEVIKQLLEKGYSVRASVRNLEDTKKSDALIRLAEALPGTIELFQADLEDPNAFNEAVKGTKYVFHVASVVKLTADDPQKEIVGPAIAGTVGLLSAVAAADPRPERVVLTSSVAAVTGFLKPTDPKNGVALTEEDWNEASELASEPYPVSKTLAERKAWEIAEKEGIDLVTILPGFVAGVSTNRAAASTSAWTGAIIAGGPVLQPMPVVDIRDVAKAHVVAAENPEAKGRYLVTGERAFDFNQFILWLEEDYPGYEFAQAEEPKSYPQQFDISKARRDLGLASTVPLRTTFRDTVRTLIALGAVQLKPRVG